MILKPSEINASKITHTRDTIRSASYFIITVFEDQFSRLLKFVLYLHRYVALLKHSYF